MRLFTILLLFFTCTVFSQETSIDSLKQVVDVSKDPDAISKAYASLLRAYQVTDSVSYKRYRVDALEHANNNNDVKEIFNIEAIDCQQFYKNGLYEKSIAKIDSLLPITTDKEFYDIAARLYNYKGSCYAVMSDYTKATVHFLSYLETAKKTDDVKAVAMANNNVGMSLLNMKRYEQAIPYIEASLEYQDKYESKIKSRAYWNMGICYLELLQYDKALEIFKTGVVVANEANDRYGAAGNQTCIASVFARKRDFDKGISAYIKAYEMSVDAKLEDFKIIEALGGIIWVYNMSSQPEKAVKYIEITDSIIEANNMPDIRNREYLFFKSTNLMQRGKPLEADPYFLRYEKALDSMYNVKNIEIIQEKETAFRTKEKEQELELKEAELSSQRLLTALLASGAILLGLIGFLVFRQQRLKLKQQRQEQELKEALATVETKNKLEEQRLRISKELHDNIGSQLTYLAGAAQNIGFGMKKVAPEVTEQKLDDLSKFSQDAIADLRDTVWVMNRTTVTWSDLTERIRYLAHKVSNTTGLQVNVTQQGDDDDATLDPSQTMNIFRIIQEAVNNAVKHAQATKLDIKVLVTQSPKIEIIDNGIGYDASVVTNSSNGLQNMESRAKELGASLVTASNSEGTTVSLELPKYC